MQIRALVLGVLPPRQFGVAISLSGIVSGIARAGHPVCAVAPITTDTLKQGDWFAARVPGMRVVRYWLPEFHIETLKPQAPDIAASERDQVLRIVSELSTWFEPNVVIAGRSTYGHLVQTVARNLRLPWALLLRGSPCGQIASGEYPDEAAAPYLDLYRSADLVIAVGRHIADGLEARHGITGIRTIGNTVDLEVFRPLPVVPERRVEFGVPEGHACVLLPGTLVPRKRPFDLLRAAERVLERSPDVTFILAGDGRLREELWAFCQARGIARNVHLVGIVDHRSMPELYNVADVVVMCSEMEGISRVYLEALACGRPLLASDIAAAREVIQDGENAFLFRLGDHHHLAERITALLDGRCARDEVAGRARESVAGCSPDEATRRYVMELQDLVRRRAASSTA